MSIKDVITTEEDIDTDTDTIATYIVKLLICDDVVVQSTNLEWFLPDRDKRTITTPILSECMCLYQINKHL